MNKCGMNHTHEATGFYRSSEGGEYYLCEACAELLSPRPTILYPLRTRGR
jgi:YHS domain-containing protein